MRTILFAALATAAVAHAVKPDYYKHGHGQEHGSDSYDSGDMAEHDGSYKPGDYKPGDYKHGDGKGFLDSWKHSGSKDASHGDWNDDDSDLETRGLFSKHQAHNPENTIEPIENEEWYDDEGRVLDGAPGHTSDDHVEAWAAKNGNRFPHAEHYDDQGRVKSHHVAREASLDDGFDYEDDESDDYSNLHALPKDEASTRQRAEWYNAERGHGHNGEASPQQHGSQGHKSHKPVHKGPIFQRSNSDDDEDDDDDGEEDWSKLDALPQDAASRRHREAWYKQEKAANFPGNNFAPPTEFVPSHHRHYSKHQMRGVEVKRDDTTNDDQYYYDVGNEGDEGEYDPSYGSEEYEDEEFEKREAAKKPKPAKAPKPVKPKKGNGWSLFPW